MSRRKEPAKTSGEHLIAAVDWYREDQWSRLQEVAADPEELEGTYAEWREMAESDVEELTQFGLRIERVDVDVEELVDWCESQGRPVNRAARAEFANRKLWEKHGIQVRRR